MSLIATHLNKFGIVLLSDSNLSDSTGNAGFGQKVFPIPHLNAGLAYTGTYHIQGKNVAEWMNDFISGSAFTTKTIEEFCNILKQELDKSLYPHEFDITTIIHVAGYQEEHGLSHLEHWHISNAPLLLNGYYTTPTNKFFNAHNDFSTKSDIDHRKKMVEWDSDPTNRAQFFNGTPEGRMAYYYIQSVMENTLIDIWTKYSHWNFRKPTNLFETSSIIKLYFDFVSHLFKLSTHSALYIGGEIQSHLIPVPHNIDKTIP